MPKWAIGIIVVSVPLLLGAGLQVSGYQSITLAIALWVLAGCGAVFLLLTLPPIAKRINLPLLRSLVVENKTATHIYDADMGEHIAQVKDVLEEWKKQLQSLYKDKKLKKLDAVKNDTIEFQYAEQHCPSLKGIYSQLLISTGLYENDLGRLKSKQEIRKSKEWVRGKIKTVIEAIDKSLKSYEYTKNSCGGCPQNITGMSRSEVPSGKIPSRREAIEQSEVVWGLWYTGDGMRADKLLGSGKIKRILLLNPSMKNQSIEKNASVVDSTPSTVRSEINLVKNEITRYQIPYRYYDNFRRESFTIFDPTPIQNESGEFTPNSKNAWICTVHPSYSLSRDQWPRFKYENKGKDKRVFDNYFREFEDIWDNRSVKPQDMENPFEALSETKQVKQQKQIFNISWMDGGESWWLREKNGKASWQAELESNYNSLILEGEVVVNTMKPTQVESIELQIGQQLFPSDWKSSTFYISGSDGVRFDIPLSITRGKRTARIKYTVDGVTDFSDPFTINVPSKKA